MWTGFPCSLSLTICLLHGNCCVNWTHWTTLVCEGMHQDTVCDFNIYTSWLVVDLHVGE
jgi:hypothetical protein